MPPLKKIFIITIALLLATVPSLMAAQILFTPTLYVSEEYTDNVDLDPEDEKESFITTAGMTLSGQVLWRTAGLELSYSPSYSEYDISSEYNSWRHEAGLYTWKEIKRGTRLELRNTYLRTNDPADASETIDPDDPTQGPAIEGDPNRRRRNKYDTNMAEVKLIQDFGANDSFYLAYQYQLLRDVHVSEDEAEDDNDIFMPSAGLIYNFTTRWTAELETSYSITDYEDDNQNDRNEFYGQVRLLHNFNRALSGFIAYTHTHLDFDKVPFTAPADPDYTIHRPSIGIRINFQDNARITIDGGYYVQEFQDSENQEGFNVESDIYKRWEYRRGYFGIRGGSGYVIDDGGVEDNGLAIFYEGEISAGYRFTPSLTSNISGFYRYEEFPNETPGRVDQTWEAHAGLDWQALQWMAIELAYNYSNVTSDDPTNEYQENSALITIRLSPSSPYRLN